MLSDPQPTAAAPSASPGNFAATFEIDNVTDEPLFDVYGVQVPGRSFGCKISGEI